MEHGEELWLGTPQTPLNLFVFRVAAAFPSQTERGETPRQLPEVLTGVWGRAPAETTLSSRLPTGLTSYARSTKITTKNTPTPPHSHTPTPPCSHTRTRIQPIPGDCLNAGAEMLNGVRVLC